MKDMGYVEYVVYEKASGKILRSGTCTKLSLQRQIQSDNEEVIEGRASDALQKVVDGKIVDKTPEEIAIDNPPLPKIPQDDIPAHITKKQLQNLLDRLERLEER